MRRGITSGIGVLAVAISLSAFNQSAVSAAPTWHIVPSASPHGSAFSVLLGVACPSAAQCNAVGFSQDANATSIVTLVERWDGKAWAIVPSPNPSGLSKLNAVTCLSATNCTAVGSFDNPSHTTTTTLIETWNGTVWAIAPDPALISGSLDAVACPSASRCVAVGHMGANLQSTLIEQWYGSTWTALASPNGPGPSALHGVSCPSADNCTAVGSAFASPGQRLTLAEHWDGTAWAVVPTPNPGPTPPAGGVATTLTAVSCPATRCFAVGTTNVTPTSTVVEAWDGATWAITPVPSPGPRGGELSSVSCPSATRCSAVGESLDVNDAATTLVEQWDGRAWTVGASPNPAGAVYSGLASVSCLSGLGCAAVGFASTDPTSATRTTLGESSLVGGGPGTTTTTATPVTTCAVTGVRPGPPTQQDVTVQNPAGVATIANIQIVNGTVAQPVFTPGTTSPIVVTATKSNQSLRTVWSFDVTSSAGRTDHCG